MWSAISKRIPESWRWCLAWWSGSRIVLAAWGWLLYALNLTPRSMLHPEFYPGINPLLNAIPSPLQVWLRWDSLHYLRIAEYGYSDPTLSAFFPLYPLLARLLSPPFLGASLGGLMVVTNLAFLLALVQFYHLVEELFDSVTARRAVMLLVAFPTAFFFFLPYPHSLSLLLVLSAYRAARRQHWLLTLACGLLAGLCHPSTLPLPLLLIFPAWRAWRQKPTWRRLGILAVPFASLLGTGSFFLWCSGQGFQSYLNVQSDTWGTIWMLPWQIIPALLRSPYLPSIGWFNFAVLILSLALLLLAARRLPTENWLFLLGAVLYFSAVAKAGEPLISFGRKILFVFPLFILLSLWVRQRSDKLALFFASLQLYFCGLFYLWAWVG